MGSGGGGRVGVGVGGVGIGELGVRVGGVGVGGWGREGWGRGGWGRGVGSGELSSSRQIVLASNRHRVKSSCTLGHLGQMSTLGKWDVFGTNGHVGTGTNEHLGEWAFWGKYAL